MINLSFNNLGVSLHFKMRRLIALYITVKCIIKLNKTKDNKMIECKLVDFLKVKIDDEVIDVSSYSELKKKDEKSFSLLINNKYRCIMSKHDFYMLSDDMDK